MDNTLNFKTPNGDDFQLSFNPEGGIIVSLEKDTTPLKITVQSPTKKESQDWVGGAKKH